MRGLGYGRGEYERVRVRARWLRLYDADGRLVPNRSEVAAAEQQRAEAAERERELERQRAEAAERRAAELAAELERLHAQLGK